MSCGASLTFLNLLNHTKHAEGKDRDSFLELLYAAGLCNMAKFEEEAVAVQLQGVRPSVDCAIYTRPYIAQLILLSCLSLRR